MGTFCHTHFLSFFLTVSKAPFLTDIGTALNQWTALYLKLAINKLESPLNDSPNLIWPSVAFLVP